ncbi:MAG TPA: type I methionyl aminopeptidase [Rhodothermia bacterium]|nr:type I methionyl aminopeptidase [Rhodothermia bacterium]
MVHLKSHSEIEALRRSADLVSRTLGEVARHLVEGITTSELDVVAETFIRDHGAEPAFKGYRVGSATYPATLCVSINDEVVHGIPGSRIIQAGDVVSIDCGVVVDGYYGDSAYTFVVGDVKEDTARLLRTTYEALYDGIAMAVAGNRVGDIGHAVQTRCEAEGFGVVYELVGHGIGRGLHEEPQVPNVGRRGTGRKLKAGTTICIEPMITLGTSKVSSDDDGWTVRTADGSVCAHYEHMVVVRAGGAEILSTFDFIEKVVEPPYRMDLVYGETAAN